MVVALRRYTLNRPAGKRDEVVGQSGRKRAIAELLIRRGLGAVIDLIVLFIILLVPDYLLGSGRYRATLWVWIGVQALYFLVAEGLWGRTVGKLATGTVIVDSAGNAPGLLKAAAVRCSRWHLCGEGEGSEQNHTAQRRRRMSSAAFSNVSHSNP